MDHSFGRDGTHPVLRAAGVIAEAMKAVRDVEPAFMSVRDRRTALVTLPVLRDQLEALWLQVIAVSDDVAEESGARDVGAWLTAEARIDRPVAAGSRRRPRRWMPGGASWAVV